MCFNVITKNYLLNHEIGHSINFKKLKEVMAMSILAGKKVVIIGDRDGVPGPAIEECAKSAGAEVVFSSTECFV